MTDNYIKSRKSKDIYTVLYNKQYKGNSQEMEKKTKCLFSLPVPISLNTKYVHNDVRT